MIRIWFVIALVLWAACPTAPPAAESPRSVGTFHSDIRPFLETYCIRCHGPEKSKANVTLHTLHGDLATGQQLPLWEKILNVLRSGEMPPEDERQPDASSRRKVAQWIETGLRDNVTAISHGASTAPTTRRLTNIEYENSLRDLLGFKLNIISRLPEDPVKPYHFNNTPEFMRLGPEQIDRYLEVARFAMASAIVDPGKPTVHTTERTWNANGVGTGMGLDEIGVEGNRRNAASTGMGLKSFPIHGEFRIRFRASAILPEGYTEVPLRLAMGYPLDRNIGSLEVKEVCVVSLSNSPDHPREFEFRGRIENFPAEPMPFKDGKAVPDRLHINPQNIFDNGTLNDLVEVPRNLALPRVVLHSITFEAPIADTWPPPHHTRILFDSPLRDSNPTSYMREVLVRFMSRAFRRPPTTAEVDLFTRSFTLIRPGVDTFEAAARETLALVLITPQFLLHANPVEGSHRHYEIASRLAYFLWASMPDDQLLSLAAQGRLDDPAVLEAQALRMLTDEKASDFIANFTTQWLSLTKVKTVPINTDLFPRFLNRVQLGERAGTEVPFIPTVRDYLIQETIGFIGELVRRNESILRIVDSDFVYINDRLAAHYGIPGVQGVHFRPVPIKPEQRLGGLLTQSAMLIGNGTGTAPHPIYRAVWLREAILGDTVPPPPAEVPALADSAGASAEKALTIADLLAKHRQVESCNDCHVRLDPWGIPFEHYNAIGIYQPLVPKEGAKVQGFHFQHHKSMQNYHAYLASLNTERISAESRVPQGPQVNDLEGLKQFLLTERKQAIAENVLRRLLAYAIGRELTFRDRFAVKQLCDQSEKNGYRFRDLIIAVCRSDLFRELPSLKATKP